MGNDLSRRSFLKTTGLITLSFSLVPVGCGGDSTGSSSAASSVSGALPASLRRAPRIDAWLQILPEGRIRVLTGKLELGQGIRIAIAQVAAEELNTHLDRVEVHLAETGVTPNERYTSASVSIEHSAMSVRHAAATARDILRQRGAEQLGVDADQIVVENGRVRTGDGSESLTFSEAMSGEQIEEEVTAPADFKPTSERQWIGQSVPRRDIEQMVRGESVYVQDLRFPDMVHARVVRPRGYGATLQTIDEDALRENVPGVLHLVVDGSFVSVITETEHQAEQAQDFLTANTEWSAPDPLPTDQPLKEHLRALPTNATEVTRQGTVDVSGSELRASYFRPYVMHGSIGPSCAVARFDGEQLQVWTHSQGVYPLRDTLTNLVDLPADQIRVTGVPGSGCYGHNGADDVAADAALLAMAMPNRPIRLQWSRANEHGWEPYGSAMIMDVTARLDDNGRIDSWQYTVWSDTHSTRPGGDPGNLLPARYQRNAHPLSGRGFLGGGYRNAPPYYTIPNQQIDARFFEGPLRVSALRGLGAHANVFAIECFMDELADAAGTDPVAFRLAHLDDPRAADVLTAVRDMAEDEPLADNEGLGYSFARYKNSASYCAVAAVVRAESDGSLRIRTMWGAIDAGEVINPNGLRNQTEGGMIQSASWMMQEAVQFDAEHVTSLDWASYPIFRYPDVPDVEVAVLDRPEEPPLGAGEAAQGPATAAIANAIYHATGRRVRDLPVRTA